MPLLKSAFYVVFQFFLQLDCLRLKEMKVFQLLWKGDVTLTVLSTYENKAFIRNWNYPTDKENYLKRVQTIVSRKTKIVAIQGQLLKEINLFENT